MMEENPFPNLKVTAADFLNAIEGRTNCPKCGRSRKWYCYTCYVPVTEVADRIPKIKLPIKLDIIKHPSECDGKSTSAHAAILAPDDVNVYTYPTIPNYEPKDKVLLVFPGEGSSTLEELASRLTPTGGDSWNSSSADKVSETDENGKDKDHRACAEGGDDNTKLGNSETDINNQGSDGLRDSQRSESEPPQKKQKATDSDGDIRSENRSLDSPYDRVVFIDSTWNQTHKICIDERLKGLQRVEIKTQKTKFWRHQRDKPNTYLATIEAIYYFIVEYHDLFVRTKYEGQYDDLLFFFCFMYHKIKHLYDGGKTLKAYNKS